MPNLKFKSALLIIVLLATPFASSVAAAAQGPPLDRALLVSSEPNALESLAPGELQPVPVPEPSEQALRFYRSGNWLWLANHAWALLVPGVLAFSGASAWLRNGARRLGRTWFLTIGLYAIVYLAIVFVVDLPLSYYEGFIRLHDYGLSNQTLLRWFRNAAVGLGVDLAIAFALAWLPYLLLARSPRRWWLYTALLSVPFLFLTMLVMPIWYDPLFNHFGPMKNKELERSILGLAERAGIDGSRVFEVNKSIDTNAVNAYVTGFLQTKRIVLWDTLIAKLSEKELLCVMGHEMGHYMLGHVVRSILLSAIITVVGLLFVDKAGRWLVSRYRGRLGFDNLSDVASLPLLMMLIEVAILALSPVALAYSRFQEHEADQFALDLTRANHSAGSAFVKLQAENLSNPRPGLFYTIFRSSHPSIGDRIDFCNSYRPWLLKPSVSNSGIPAPGADRPTRVSWRSIWDTNPKPEADLLRAAGSARAGLGIAPLAQRVAHESEAAYNQ
jgi:Zn-dependent protease with chaperone function